MQICADTSAKIRPGEVSIIFDHTATQNAEEPPTQITSEIWVEQSFAFQIIYSARSATIGSTFAVRLAGM
jgi:hypothetical protein